MVVANASGELSFYYGDDTKRGDRPRAFFVPPHHATHKLCWSRGRRRERRDLRLTTLDCRPQFMSFEFNTRTSDNVELVLEGTFFWQVVDVQAMVKTTGDTTGDVCNHARSRFIQLVSQVTLKQFMDDFNSLAKRPRPADAPMTAEEAVAKAAAEGLTLMAAPTTKTGFKGALHASSTIHPALGAGGDDEFGKSGLAPGTVYGGGPYGFGACCLPAKAGEPSARPTSPTSASRGSTWASTPPPIWHPVFAAFTTASPRLSCFATRF